MVLIEFHLGLRQVIMALMNWAIDVLQKLLQSDAIPILINLQPNILQWINHFNKYNLLIG